MDTETIDIFDTSEIWKRILSDEIVPKMERQGKRTLGRWRTAKWLYKFYLPFEERLYWNCDSQLRQLLFVLKKTSSSKAKLWKAEFDSWFNSALEILTESERKNLTFSEFLEALGQLIGEVAAQGKK